MQELDFQSFAKAIQELKEIEEFQTDVCGLLNKHKKLGAEMIFPDTNSALVSLLEHLSNDDDEWIRYYIYELDYGKKYEPGTVKIDSKPVKLETIEDLWNLLTNSPTYEKGAEDMFFKEVQGNLFDCPADCYLAHCISGDFALGAGIAKVFANELDMKKKLHEEYPIPSHLSFAYTGAALLVDNVFNLVTKDRCWHKPTYETLIAALEDMRDQCLERDIFKLAMPRIGCGLDRLDWETVKQILHNVFDGTGIEITIYTL